MNLVSYHPSPHSNFQLLAPLPLLPPTFVVVVVAAVEQEDARARPCLIHCVLLLYFPVGVACLGSRSPRHAFYLQKKKQTKKTILYCSFVLRERGEDRGVMDAKERCSYSQGHGTHLLRAGRRRLTGCMLYESSYHLVHVHPRALYSAPRRLDLECS